MLSRVQVISAAAFSHRPPWSDDEPDTITVGHQIPFRVALHGILDGAMIRVLTPEVCPLSCHCQFQLKTIQWAYKLPIARLQHVKACYTECDDYLKSFIAQRKAATWDLRESDSGRRDLLGALCFASASAEEGDEEMENDEGGEKKRCKLTEEEVMGNMYVFLLAGHGEH